MVRILARSRRECGWLAHHFSPVADAVPRSVWMRAPSPVSHPKVASNQGVGRLETLAVIAFGEPLCARVRDRLATAKTAEVASYVAVMPISKFLS